MLTQDLFPALRPSVFPLVSVACPAAPALAGTLAGPGSSGPPCPSWSAAPLCRPRPRPPGPGPPPHPDKHPSYRCSETSVVPHQATDIIPISHAQSFSD